MAHRPRKRFGQHFLTDDHVVERIVEAIVARGTGRVVEIGPGEGALTRRLLAAGLTVHAVELDRDLVPYLRSTFADQDFTLTQADALTVDFSALTDARPFTVCGNLPYNISSPLLFHLAKWAEHVESMTFMLQKEMVDRILATAGGGDYGRLTVMLQQDFEGIPLFDVPPEAFFPPPAVMSAVLQLTPRSDRIPEHLRPKIAELVRVAFAHRRKTLRKTLGSVLSPAVMQACGIDSGARPETVPLEGWVRLAEQQLEAERKAAVIG